MLLMSEEMLQIKESDRSQQKRNNAAQDVRALQWHKTHFSPPARAASLALHYWHQEYHNLQ